MGKRENRKNLGSELINECVETRSDRETNSEKDRIWRFGEIDAKNAETLVVLFVNVIMMKKLKTELLSTSITLIIKRIYFFMLDTVNYNVKISCRIIIAYREFGHFLNYEGHH